MAEPIEISSEGQTRQDPRNHVLDRGLDPPLKEELLGEHASTHCPLKIYESASWMTKVGLVTKVCGGGDAACRYRYCSDLFTYLLLLPVLVQSVDGCGGVGLVMDPRVRLCVVWDSLIRAVS